MKNKILELFDRKINKLIDIRNRTIQEDWKIHLDTRIRDLQELRSEIEKMDEWIPAKIIPEFPCTLIVASMVYPTMVVEFNNIDEFSNQIPIRYIPLPPNPSSNDSLRSSYLSH